MELLPYRNELLVYRGTACPVPLLAKAIAACTTCCEAKAKPYETRVSGVLQCAERDAQLACACLAGFLIYHGIR